MATACEVSRNYMYISALAWFQVFPASSCKLGPRLFLTLSLLSSVSCSFLIACQLLAEMGLGGGGGGGGEGGGGREGGGREINYIQARNKYDVILTSLLVVSFSVLSSFLLSSVSCSIFPASCAEGTSSWDTITKSSVCVCVCV